MDLYYMSSSNVVFVCDTGRMFHTQNKPLVPEWPCIIEVSYIYPPTTGNPDVIGNYQTNHSHGSEVGLAPT
jgi:hypothetical protein